MILLCFRFKLDATASFAILMNEQRSRAFQCVLLEDYGNEIVSCIRKCDKTLQEFGQPVYFESPILHIRYENEI